MVDVLAQHCGEVPWSGDQQVVEAFAPQGADEASAIAFARGARTGLRMLGERRLDRHDFLVVGVPLRSKGVFGAPANVVAML